MSLREVLEKRKTIILDKPAIKALEEIRLAAKVRPIKLLKGSSLFSRQVIGVRGVDMGLESLKEAKRSEWRCLTGDILILTNAGGFKPIINVEEDCAFTFDGISVRPRQIEGFWQSGIRDVYEVEAGGLSIKCTDNHPFLCLQKTVPYRMLRGKMRFRWDFHWKLMKDLKVGDIVTVLREVPEEECRSHPLKILFQECVSNSGWAYRFVTPRLPAETDEDFMWLLGLFLGDGNARIRVLEGGFSGEVKFSIPKGDPARNSLITLLEKYDLSPSVDNDSVLVYSLFLAKLLSRLGLSGNAHTKRVPPWVFMLPREQKLALLAGFIDADGHVTKKGRFELSSCNKELIKDLTLLTTISGLNTSKIFKREVKEHTIKGHATGKTTMYRVVVCRNSEIPVRNSIYKTRLKPRIRKLGVQRSKWIQNRYPHLGFIRVKSIKWLGKQPVYDVSISGSDNFVANGFIVHNSKGYPEGLINMGLELAMEWSYKMSEVFAPPELREAAVRYNLPKGLEVAERWISVMGK